MKIQAKLIQTSIAIPMVVERAMQHASAVGKRAKDINGNSLFTDLTFASNEISIFNEYVTSGAHSIVAKCAYVCEGYTSEDDALTFSFRLKRFEDEDIESDKAALAEAVMNYLSNYAIAQFLSSIHPSTGAKYPPIFGSPYATQCDAILGDIINICYLRKKSTAVRSPYTSEIVLSGSQFECTANEEFTLAYSIDGDCANDIEIFAPAHVFWRKGRGGFNVLVDKAGVYPCKLYSLHNEDVSKTCTIIAK